METLILKDNQQTANPCVATIGMFDGVHKGHRFVLSHVCDYAKQQGLQSMVITFDCHPREVVQTDWKPLLLTTNEERMRLLAETGIDYVKVLHFTPEMSVLSARDFMVMMKEQLSVKVLLMGYDNRFGHHRKDTFEDYVRYGKEIGMEVESLPPLTIPELCSPTRSLSNLLPLTSHISSSLIRRLLTDGKVKEAAQCLSYPYSIKGKVVKGEHIGTELGFPTANLLPNDSRKHIPAPGVYAVEVQFYTLHSTLYTKKGMMNIGTRPTFGTNPQTLEVHILDYEGDLYGQEIRVSFMERLRDERRFDNIEELKAQLDEDKKRIEKLKD